MLFSYLPFCGCKAIFSREEHTRYAKSVHAESRWCNIYENACNETNLKYNYDINRVVKLKLSDRIIIMHVQLPQRVVFRGIRIVLILTDQTNLIR